MSRTWTQPELPRGLRFSAGGRELAVHAGHRTERIPVSHLPSGSAAAVERIVDAREPHVVVAPRFTAKAIDLLTKPGWGWIDHAGNVRIERDGILLNVTAPVRRAHALRQMLVPPQGERVVRHLLDHYPERSRWTEIARATLLDHGYTSRILRRLEEHGLITRQRRRPIELPYPSELFEVWRSGAARVVETAWASPLSPDQTAERLQRSSEDADLAFTGVFGACRLTSVLEPERVEAYVSDLRTARRLARAIGAEEADRGATLLLLIHRDPGVIAVGSVRERGLRFASPSQVYKDAVQRARGRENDAPAALRRQRLKW